MRQHIISKTLRSKNNRPRAKITGFARGLKIVHIGNDVWKFGKNSKVDGRDHMVIYGPNDKEYHVWDRDVNFLRTRFGDDQWDNNYFGYNDDYAIVNRQGNRALETKVKVYILTSILDDRKNWCSDLSCTPPIGKLKVIYQNGTVRNIDFNGTFEVYEHRHKDYPSIIYRNKPFAYRLS